MRRSLAAAFAAGLVTMGAGTANAQSINDVFAAAALQGTHIGAFTPMSAGPMKGQEMGANSIAFRFAQNDPGAGASVVRTLGGSYSMAAGTNAMVNGTVGYAMCDGCDGALMLGADLVSPLWARPGTAENNMSLTANLQGSAGYGMGMGNSDATALAAAVALPLGLSMKQASNARFSIFVTPGFGWGSFDTGTASESGTRPFYGAAVEWMAPAGWAIHAGIQNVVIDGGSTSIGAGFNWKLGG